MLQQTAIPTEILTGCCWEPGTRGYQPHKCQSTKDLHHDKTADNAGTTTNQRDHNERFD